MAVSYSNSTYYRIVGIFRKVKFLEMSVRMYWVKIFGGVIFGRLVHLNKIIDLLGNGIKISEVRIYSVSENLTLQKSSRYTVYK